MNVRCHHSIETEGGSVMVNDAKVGNFGKGIKHILKLRLCKISTSISLVFFDDLQLFAD